MNLFDLPPIALLGWPAIIISIALFVVGLVRGKPNWLIVAAVLIVPISLYFAATPRFGWFALIIPALLLGASVAIRRGLPWLAWLLFVPFVGFFGWLAVVVIGE